MDRNTILIIGGVTIGAAIGLYAVGRYAVNKFNAAIDDVVKSVVNAESVANAAEEFSEKFMAANAAADTKE